MKKVLRRVMAADETKDTRLEDMMDSLKADFDYAMDGMFKMGRTSAADLNDALVIAEALSEKLQSTISDIAEKIS